MKELKEKMELVKKLGIIYQKYIVENLYEMSTDKLNFQDKRLEELRDIAKRLSEFGVYNFNFETDKKFIKSVEDFMNEFKKGLN